MTSKNPLLGSRVLAVDPGALRCGWAVLDPGPILVESGVIRCDRMEDETFQVYRLRLEEHAGQYFDELLDWPLRPQRVVSEIIPPQGFSNSSQAYLGNCVASVLHDCAFKQGVEVSQVSAATVKKNIGIKGRTGKVSKAGVRNGVVTILPNLRQYVADSAWPWDRWDAVAIGLDALGVTLP